MTDAEPRSRHAAMDLRPDAVLSIGIACDPVAEGADDIRAAQQDSLALLLLGLAGSLQRVVTCNPGYFSAAPALCRVIRSAEACDLGTPAHALPFCWMTLSPTPGSTGIAATSPPRDRERAQDMLIANSDVLVAVWDGARAAHRGGVDVLAQAAVAARIPLLVISSTVPTQTYLLLQDDDDLATAIATDLAPKPVPAELDSLVRGLLLPHGSLAQRRLSDLCGEPQWPASFRWEYEILLALFMVRSRRQAASAPSPSPPGAIAPELQSRTERLDRLAGYYANLSRSSSTGEYLLLIVMALLSTSMGLLVPSLSGVSIVVQVIVNGLIIIDITIRRRHRWVERWLDYRAMAERLRAIQILHPVGQADGQHLRKSDRRSLSWIDWYCRRVQRMLPPSDCASLAAKLPAIVTAMQTTIDSQLAYHRRAFSQLKRLEHRLYVAARIALVATILIGAGLSVATYADLAARHGVWHGVALLALAILPASVAAFNGIRNEADLAQLIERSALTFSRLIRLRRALGSHDLTPDRVVNAASGLARLMDDELSQWRLMLNNWRLRRSR